jgi:hypothetical protein
MSGLALSVGIETHAIDREGTIRGAVAAQSQCSLLNRDELAIWSKPSIEQDV